MLREAKGTIEVITADDHPIARRGLRALLAEAHDITVLAEAEDADAGRAAIAEHRPDVAVMDLSMPGQPMLELLPELYADFPETRVIILTMQGDPAYARRALQSGAAGYVLKDSSDEDVLAAIRTVAAGSRYLTSRIPARLASSGVTDRPGGLSSRQLEILAMIARGYTNLQIAERLALSVRTIESHRAHIQQKLAVDDRHGLVRFAFDHGLVGSSR